MGVRIDGEPTRQSTFDVPSGGHAIVSVRSTPVSAAARNAVGSKRLFGSLVSGWFFWPIDAAKGASVDGHALSLLSSIFFLRASRSFEYAPNVSLQLLDFALPLYETLRGLALMKPILRVQEQRPCLRGTVEFITPRESNVCSMEQIAASLLIVSRLPPFAEDATFVR
jgi:hypothetical protein